jgi:hypothetical protein
MCQMKSDPAKRKAEFSFAETLDSIKIVIPGVAWLSGRIQGGTNSVQCLCWPRYNHLWWSAVRVRLLPGACAL